MNSTNDNTPRTLAEQLAALMTYRNRPHETVEPLQSNWTTVPANDNADPEEVIDFGFERHLRMTPSVKEIMRNVKDGPVVKNGAGQIVEIGKLHFSDGTQTEKAFTRGPDGDLIQYDRVMPAGAMLRTREKAEGPAGGKGFTDVDLENSDKFYASVFGTDVPRFIKRGERRNGPSMTQEQSRANLEAAIANTPVLPQITYCPKALPCGSERVSDNFIGFKKAPSGQSGSIAWQDIAQTIENAKVWKNLRKALKSDDVAVLDAAMQAQSLQEIGEIADGPAHKRTNERRAVRRLRAANDNLVAVIKKVAG